MSDYIKREEALSALCDPCAYKSACYSGDEIPACPALWTMLNIPAADVVEVVRCKDCIWHDHEAEEPGMVYCSEMVGGWVKSNFYCADGERRSE